MLNVVQGCDGGLLKACIYGERMFFFSLTFTPPWTYGLLSLLIQGVVCLVSAIVSNTELLVLSSFLERAEHMLFV